MIQKKHRQRQDLQSKTLTQDVQERPYHKTAQPQKMNELPCNTTREASPEPAGRVKSGTSTAGVAVLPQAETVTVYSCSIICIAFSIRISPVISPRLVRETYEYRSKLS